MTNKKRMAIATLCLSMGMGMAVVGTPALFAQQTDESGQVTNPQPHTKKELKNEKKHEKQELKHNQKADKAAKKADEHQGKLVGAGPESLPCRCTVLPIVQTRT